MMCRACLAVMVVGADATVCPTVVVIVAIPTLDWFGADGLPNGKDSVQMSLFLLLMRLLVSAVPYWFPPSSLLLLGVPALLSVVLLLHLYGWVGCLKCRLLHLVHYLLLIDALIKAWLWTRI